MRLGVVGGTGSAGLFPGGVPIDLPGGSAAEPWGPVSSAPSRSELAGHEIIFLARHGTPDAPAIAPHRVNYRANIWALRELGVDHVIAINAVGGIARAATPGRVVIPDQIIDYTWGRKSTYFEGAEQPVVHVDFTHPYCPDTRRLVADAAAEVGVDVVARGTYAAVQGPRLETAAEINRLERDGADLVGMTGMPEAALARELQLPYAALAVVANAAAGRGESSGGISHEEIGKVLQEAMSRVRRVVEKVVERNGRP